jgi:SAM-dependent methyltransferase
LPGQQDGTSYSDADAAALYDVLNRWGPSDDFYFTLLRDVESVLDVGCGTGTLLHHARQAGHTGRLCGVDPDRAMLDVARTHPGIEWWEGTAASMTWTAEFDLAVMTGHAFQCLITDEEVRASLLAIRTALVPGGQFAFETRNPLVRAWEQWDVMDPIDAVDPQGRAVRVSYDVEDVVDDVVALAEVTSDGENRRMRVDRARLRFMDNQTLAAFLDGAGFDIEAQYGNWDRSALSPSGPEIITIARSR